MEYLDYYAVLGVERDADDKAIRQAFRKLARQYHPDLNPGDSTAEAKFKQVNEAYEVLSNKEKRQKYDTLGANWEQISRDEETRRHYAARDPGAGVGDFSDFFSTFFGGGRHAAGSFRDAFGRPPAAAHALDIEAELPITLEEAATGSTRRLELQTDDVCAHCRGTGLVSGEATREGNVRVMINAQTCPSCRGEGVVPGHRVVNARIPPGATAGTRLRLAGQGGRSGDTSGDLFLRIRLAAHPVFTADGRDLHCELPVWDFEAALGAQVDAPALGGRVRVKVPAGSQSGQTLRLRGKGLPGRRGAAPGDLLFTLKVVVPAPLDAEERELFTQLQERVGRHHVSPREELLRRAG